MIDVAQIEPDLQGQPSRPAPAPASKEVKPGKDVKDKGLAKETPKKETAKKEGFRLDASDAFSEEQGKPKWSEDERVNLLLQAKLKKSEKLQHAKKARKW
jgi:hypothetical protein